MGIGWCCGVECTEVETKLIFLEVMCLPPAHGHVARHDGGGGWLLSLLASLGTEGAPDLTQTELVEELLVALDAHHAQLLDERHLSERI